MRNFNARKTGKGKDYTWFVWQRLDVLKYMVAAICFQTILLSSQMAGGQRYLGLSPGVVWGTIETDPGRVLLHRPMYKWVRE